MIVLIDLTKFLAVISVSDSSFKPVSCELISVSVIIVSKVVSMPCQELFEKQSNNFKDDILDKNSLIVTIEAGSISSWKKYSGDKGISIGINKFGESAPYKKIYEHFDLSVEKIVNQIQDTLRNNPN